MPYHAPVDDIMFALKTAAGFDALVDNGIYAGLDEETVKAIVEEAGKFGSSVLDPLNAPGDKQGSKLADGRVSTPPGWKEAYTQFREAGWTDVVYRNLSFGIVALHRATKPAA